MPSLRIFAGIALTSALVFSGAGFAAAADCQPGQPCNYPTPPSAPPSQGQGQQPQGPVRLLEPLGELKEVPMSSGGKPALLVYFADALGWIQEIAVGFTILWLIVGGIMIMVSGNNNSLREQGKNHAQWAITGLLMLFTIGFILELLNASFFEQ